MSISKEFWLINAHLTAPQLSVKISWTLKFLTQKLNHKTSHFSHDSWNIFTNSWSMTNKKEAVRVDCCRLTSFAVKMSGNLILSVSISLRWICFRWKLYSLFEIGIKLCNKSSHLFALVLKLCRRCFRMWYRSVDDHYCLSLIQCFVTFFCNRYHDTRKCFSIIWNFFALR